MSFALSKPLPPAAISPGYRYPDLFVIGRSCGRLRDSGITWRFVGSDVGGGGWFVEAVVGGGLVVVGWLDCGRGR